MSFRFIYADFIKYYQNPENLQRELGARPHVKFYRRPAFARNQPKQQPETSELPAEFIDVFGQRIYIRID
jgi:hypothetical protein